MCQTMDRIGVATRQEEEGKFIRFSITINLLIAIYPIVSNSAHVYNNCIWGGGVDNLLIRGMSARIIKNYYKHLLFLYIKRRLVLYERVVDKHVSSRDMSDAMMNNTCFNTPDQSTLNIIDPDFHYLTVNSCPIDTPCFSEQLFRDKYGNNTNLSMLHLNIRSVPDRFFGLISFLDNLTIELKIIALSETWIKPYHIDYNMPH